ncbi:MAG: type II secretion system F family protein [Acidimicrobiales bacterium]
MTVATAASTPVRWRAGFISLAAALLGMSLGGFAVLVGAAHAADAQEGGDRLVVRAVDATDPSAVQVTFSWSGDPGDLSDLEVLDGGRSIEVEPVPGAVGGDVVAIVVDTSASTDGGVLDASRAAVADLLAGLPAGTEVSLVLAGDAAERAVGRTADRGRVTSELATATSAGDGALLAGVVEAAEGLRTASAEGRPVAVVLVTDGVVADTTGQDAARATLAQVGAPLYVAGARGGSFDEAGFTALASATGGRVAAVDASAELVDATASIGRDLGRLATFSYEPDAEGGMADLTLSVGETATEARYLLGSTMVGPIRLQPVDAPQPAGPDALRSDAAKWGAIGAIALAVTIAAVAIGATFSRREDGLSRAMRPYDESVEGEDDADSGGFATTAIVQRAVAATEAFATKRGFLVTVERRLERADVPLRAGEAIFFWGVAVVIAVVGGFFALGSLLLGLGVGLVFALLPAAVVNYLAARKQRKFESQLPDMLQLLSSTLRAGYSLMQGVEAVSTEAPDPIGRELRKVVTEARLGRPLEAALDAVAERMDSADFAWAVMAIGIQREVGGNLSELLLTVGETMTERERLRREVKTLTAEGKMSAVVLGLLTPGIAVTMFRLNPDYIGLLFTNPIGRIMLIGGVLLAGGGFLWMSKMMKIEV